MQYLFIFVDEQVKLNRLAQGSLRVGCGHWGSNRDRLSYKPPPPSLRPSTPSNVKAESRGRGQKAEGWKPGNGSKLRLISCFITNIFYCRKLIRVGG